MKSDLVKGKSIFFAILAVAIITATIVVLRHNHLKSNIPKFVSKTEVDNASRLTFSGDYEKAIDSLSNASFANSGEEIQGRTALAESYFALKNYQSAADQCVLLLSKELEPLSKSNIDNLLANIYRDSGNVASARQYYSDAITNNSKNSQAWINYSYMEYSQNNKDKALEIITSAKQAMPTDSSIQSAAQRLKT